MSEVIDLLQRLVHVDTVNPPGDETRAAELLIEWYERVAVTQGTPVELLGKLIKHEMYPELWAARNELTTVAKEQD
jgi:acetylornithine deacetylase/succinyl-diaminopimelate desuccinylase-like protein